jgi:hypothetical protein
VSQALERIRKVAGRKEKFTALFHHINVDLLEGAFYERKADAAPGVDRLTWKDYEVDFLGFSYRFRPERGTHDAMDALCVGIVSKKVLVLRRDQPAMAFPGTPDRRPAHHPSDPEMAEGGYPGRWGRYGQVNPQVQD